jgi:hypothetical protein
LFVEMADPNGNFSGSSATAVADVKCRKDICRSKSAGAKAPKNAISIGTAESRALIPAEAKAGGSGCAEAVVPA